MLNKTQAAEADDLITNLGAEVGFIYGKHTRLEYTRTFLELLIMCCYSMVGPNLPRAAMSPLIIRLIVLHTPASLSEM